MPSRPGGKIIDLGVRGLRFGPDPATLLGWEGGQKFTFLSPGVQMSPEACAL